VAQALLHGLRVEQLAVEGKAAAIGFRLARLYPYIEPVHLLAALINQEGGSARPILQKAGARLPSLVAALQAARQALEDGYLVCIFAEGQMTRIGQLLPFRRGFERIMRGG
jgi:hypothetical protein